MVFSISAVESGLNNIEAFQRIENNPGADNAADGSSGGGGSKTPSPAIIALLAINGLLVVRLIVLGAMYFRKPRAASRISRRKQLYTSISVSRDPLFAAPSTKTGRGELGRDASDASDARARVAAGEECFFAWGFVMYTGPVAVYLFLIFILPG
ncbi:hypothetical protein B0H17DRAFT_1014401, partial [Mycena rosella]